MSYKNLIVNLSILLTLGLFGIASFYPLESMWGINHLHFLPDIFTYLHWVAVAIVIYLMIGPIPEKLFDRIINKIDSWLWGESIIPRLVFVAICTILFYWFRVETHFLGDGYFWLKVFGLEEAYTHNLIEPGAILIIKSIQNMLGGYSYRTALLAFQSISIICGFIFILNVFSIIGKICNSSRLRIFGFVTFCLSGILLLFLGYVEFYPLLWAASTTFIYCSIKFVFDEKFFWLVIFTFLISFLMHIQALYFLGGFIFIIAYKFIPHKFTSILEEKFNFLLITFIFIGFLLIGLINLSNIQFIKIFLPFLSGKPYYPDYAILSYKHILDIINLVFLIFPGIITLIFLLVTPDKENTKSMLSKLLVLFSVGSLMFLVTVNPILGMARDWDLMSMTLLCPGLLVIHKLNCKRNHLTLRTVITYSLLVLCLTISYLAIYINSTHSKQKTFSILKYYGNKDRGGWITFISKLNIRKENFLYQDAVKEMNRFFPDYKLLNEVYDLIDQKQYPKAFETAQKLVEKKPNQADFLQVLGNLYGKKGDFEKAEILYKKALETKPYHVIYNELGQLYQKQYKYDEALKVFKEAHRLSPKSTFVTEGLGLTYIYLNRYDKADLLADSLFIQNKISPGGHLLKMVIAIKTNNLEKAANHYKSYLKYGSNRSDYKSLSEHYQFLLQKR